MMTYKQVQDRLKEIQETKQQIELEEDFLYDQILDMQAIAADVQSSALETMNGGEAHV